MVPGLWTVTRTMTLRPSLMDPRCPAGRAMGHQLSLPSLRGRRISREDVASWGSCIEHPTKCPRAAFLCHQPPPVLSPASSGA